ncbi:MAG: exodeoxyribonuclease VII large subunit [Chloroflexota bacterium]
MQPTLLSTQQWTVSRLTSYIRRLVETDVTLQDVTVTGEVSNLARPASGHVYFTLKDASASLKCVMWKASAARLRLALQDGLAVEVHGRVGIYEASGQYQLYVDQIRPVGAGALYAEFMRLKAVLEAEGLFDPERKRPIPGQPRRIGIVTSATGAALRDMLHTLRRRLPLAEVILAPSPVQGVEAPPALARALTALDALEPDVILVARGGGSIEDLWAFNDERVVRAVAASRAPVICGVGHETDFTLCDFAADLRAPTPTAAAELASQTTVDDLRALLAEFESRLASSMTGRIQEEQGLVDAFAARLRYVSPERRIQSERQRLDELSRRTLSALTHRIQLQVSRVEGVSQRLQALNPASILARGYAIVTRQEDGQVVSRVSQAQGALTVRVSDGQFETVVNRQS